MRWLERVVVVLLFALGMGATLYPRTLVNWRQLGVSFDSVHLLALVLLCLALGSMILRARMIPRVCNVLKQTPDLALLLLLALASTTWSTDQSSTLSRAVMLSGTCLVSLCIGLHYNAEQILTLIIATVATLAVATIVSVSLSATATHPELDGAWRGVFIHKNFLGRAMLIGFVALLMKLRSADLSQSARLGYSLILTLVGALILLSRSTTAWVLASVAAGLSVYLPCLLRPTARRSYAVVIGGGLLGVLLGAAAILDPAGILQFLGKNDTLTGRTALWDIVFPHMWQRPWLGYGYGVFWEPFRYSLWRSGHWPAPHPHNGYIQLVLDLGVVGLLLFALCFVLVLYRAMVFSCCNSRQTNLFPILVLFCLATVNVVETRLIKFDDFWWMLFGIVMALTSNEVKKTYPHESAWKKVLDKYKKHIVIALGFLVIMGIFVMVWPHFEAKRPGLSGQYYSQQNLTDLYHQRIDHLIDFRWNVRSPFPGWTEDNFSVRWTGFVRIPKDGKYEFYTYSDDGVRLWVGKEQIINNWTNHNTTVNGAALNLRAGYYPLRLEYYENKREATIRLFWKPEFESRRKQISPKYLVPSRELLKPNVPVYENNGTSETVAESQAGTRNIEK